MTAPTVALELYTVRDELERDFAGTLRCIAAMGYPAVEGGHYRTVETGAMKALLDETGLQVPAVLVGLPALEADLDAEIDYCRAIGSSYLVLSWVHPALVVLELDVYWAAYAGADPAAYLRRRSGRVPLIHLKDMAADRSFADVGDGALDLPEIFRAAEDGGARWYVVENHRPRMP